MTIIDNGPYLTTTLVYHAPVDEKTKKLREDFKIDESGYPEHYKWRQMAKLGAKYNPEDPFLKFDPPKPDSMYSTQVALIGGLALGSFGGVAMYNFFKGVPLWARAHYGLGIFAFLTGSSLFGLKKTEERQFIKNASIVDYTNQHPDRFGPITRYKYREALHPYKPVR